MRGVVTSTDAKAASRCGRTFRSCAHDTAGEKETQGLYGTVVAKAIALNNASRSAIEAQNLIQTIAMHRFSSLIANSRRVVEVLRKLRVRIAVVVDFGR